MAGFKILTFEKISLYFISAVMALGTINPLNLGGSNREEEVQSFLIYPALLMIIVSFIFDKRTKALKFKTLKICTIFLLILLGVILSSDIIYSFTNTLLIESSFVIYIKLLMCIVSFYILSLLFLRTKDIHNNLLIYSITMVIIVLPFFTNIGVFSNCFEFSNGRLWMYGENPNTFSARLCVAILFFAYSLTQKQNNLKLKVLFGVFIVLLFYFVILSGSRGSLAIVGLSLLYLFLRKLSFTQIIIILIPLIIITASILIKLADSEMFIVFDRFQSLTSQGDLREILMAEAIDIWKKYPILGCGQNGYNNEKLILFKEFLDSHCIVTSVLAMSGIIGLCTFSLYIGYLMKYVASSVRQSPFPLILCIFMFTVSLKTGGIISYFFMYYVYAISITYAYLLKAPANSYGQSKIKKASYEYSLHL